MNYGILTFAVMEVASAFTMASDLTSTDLLAGYIGSMLRLTAGLAFGLQLVS